MKKIVLLIFLFAVAILLDTSPSYAQNVPEKNNQAVRFFSIQSVDTMKYSRDLAREKMYDPSFDEEIERQVSAIAKTGATHVAIGTPYDDEFIPFMKRWVEAARKHNLNVWFRGNLSGWEGWFGYPLIDRTTHTQNIVSFISNNPTLFEDGDIFVSCPECENGGPGDPRFNGDVEGHRAFLIEEYRQVQKAFQDIDSDVQSNLYSMNGDVARLVMDKKTTKALDGIVTIDHYVLDPDKLQEDSKILHEQSGGKIVLGELGVPIPDIHGHMTPDAQADWIKTAIEKLAGEPYILGINYWVGTGGSTALWEEDGNPKPAVSILTTYFNPRTLSATVTNTRGRPIHKVTVYSPYDVRYTEHGLFSIPVAANEELIFEKKNYKTVRLNASSIEDSETVEMEQIQKSLYDHILDFVYPIFSK